MLFEILKTDSPSRPTLSMYQLIDQLFKLAEKLLSHLPKVSEITGLAETIVDTMVTANSSNEAAVLNIMVGGDQNNFLADFRPWTIEGLSSEVSDKPDAYTRTLNTPSSHSGLPISVHDVISQFD